MKRIHGIILFFFCISILASMSCGKKGPPFLSQTVFDSRVIHLMGKYEDGDVILRGKIVAPGGQEQVSTIVGCRVFYAWYASENAPCKGCPVRYEDHRDVTEKIINEEGFYCRFPEIVKKGIYYFEVRLIDRDGSVGPPSNRMGLIIDQH